MSTTEKKKFQRRISIIVDKQLENKLNNMEYHEQLTSESKKSDEKKEMKINNISNLESPVKTRLHFFNRMSNLTDKALEKENRYQVDNSNIFLEEDEEDSSENSSNYSRKSSN